MSREETNNERRSASTSRHYAAFLDAFNRHDLDAVMSYFAEDCVLEMPRGPDPWGERYSGQSDAVRAGLATRFAGLPDAHWGEDRHWV